MNPFGIEYKNVTVTAATGGTAIWSADSAGGRRDCHSLNVNVDTLTGGFLKIGTGADGGTKTWFYTTTTGVFPLNFPGAGNPGSWGAAVSYSASGTIKATFEIGTHYEAAKITS